MIDRVKILKFPAMPVWRRRPRELAQIAEWVRSAAGLF
jgi:hypothetical protein